MKKKKLKLIRCCRTCEWNFPVSQGSKKDKETGELGYTESKKRICASNQEITEEEKIKYGCYSYGESIKDTSKIRNYCWDISYKYWCQVEERQKKEGYIFNYKDLVSVGMRALKVWPKSKMTITRYV